MIGAPLTVEILRTQLLQVEGECLVAIGGVTMSTASYAIASSQPGGKCDLSFVPLNALRRGPCGCGIGKRDADCDLHREGK